MRLQSTALLDTDERILIDKWLEYLQYRKLYPDSKMTPLDYLRGLYGYVPIDLLKNFMALDFMASDSDRMQKDLDKQKKEFENRMKTHGKNFERL